MFTDAKGRKIGVDAPPNTPGSSATNQVRGEPEGSRSPYRQDVRLPPVR
jgi:hypothetical protein